MAEDEADSESDAYTAKEVQQIRGIAYHMAQITFEKHFPGVKADNAYRFNLLQYAESIAQTYIIAGVTPEDFKKEIHKVKKQA